MSGGGDSFFINGFDLSTFFLFNYIKKGIQWTLMVLALALLPSYSVVLQWDQLVQGKLLTLLLDIDMPPLPSGTPGAMKSDVAAYQRPSPTSVVASSIYCLGAPTILKDPYYSPRRAMDLTADL